MHLESIALNTVLQTITVKIFFGFVVHVRSAVGQVFHVRLAMWRNFLRDESTWCRKKEMSDKEFLEQLCKTWEKTLNRATRLTAPIANCPNYGSDDSDTSTLEGEEATVDEAITVLPKKEEKKDRRFYTRRRKRYGWDKKNVETFRTKADQHEFTT